MIKYKHLHNTLPIPEGYEECEEKEATHCLLMGGLLSKSKTISGQIFEVELEEGLRSFTVPTIKQLGAIACFLKRENPLKIVTELTPTISATYGAKIINVNHLDKLRVGFAYKVTIEEIQDNG